MRVSPWKELAGLSEGAKRFPGMRRLIPLFVHSRLLIAVALFVLALPDPGRAEPTGALDPLLTPHAQKYDAEIERLRATKVSDLRQAETQYAAALDAAITAAPPTDAALPMMKKEREGVQKGILAPSNPSGLPESVATARKSFLSAAGRAAHLFHTEKKKVDDAYLKVLADLSKQAKGKNAVPGLAGQIAGEKRRVAKP